MLRVSVLPCGLKMAEEDKLEDFKGKCCRFVGDWLKKKGLQKLCAVFEEMSQFGEAYFKVFGNRIALFRDETSQEEIKEMYDDWATEYDKDILKAARFEGFNPLVKMLDDVVQDELKDIPKDKIKIMDAGAGTGLVGAELHKFGFMTIDALDISLGMLNEAKKKNVYTKFICAALGDQQISEVKTGEYDILVCVGALLIAHVPPVALVEIMRMVRPGGLVCFGIRDAEMETYHGKMVELEKAGHCKLVKKKKVPHYERDDLTKESNALVYKVLKH